VTVASRAAVSTARSVADVISRIRAPQPDFSIPPLLVDPIDISDLRKLIDDLRPVVDKRSEDLFGTTTDTVVVSMRLWLPDTAVAPVAASLCMIERAWRLAIFAAAPEEIEIPASPTVSLSELVPLETHGLFFAAVEIGSFGSVFRDARMSTRRAAAIVDVIAALCTISAFGTQVVAEIGHGGDQPQQTQVAPPAEPLSTTIKDGLGSLPPGSRAEIVVNGESVRVRITLGQA
jgi:hypothetical protein